MDVLRKAISASLLVLLASLLPSLVHAGAAIDRLKQDINSPHAVIGNDYPAKLANAPQDSLFDPWRFYNRECTSFVAWRLNNVDGVGFNDFFEGPQWGNAENWGPTAESLGIAVNSTPAVGAVAWYAAGTVSSLGHVAWVAVVNSNGTVDLEEYNYSVVGGYDVRNNVSDASISGFIHIRDIAQSSAPAAPSAPTVTGSADGSGAVNGSWSAPNNNGASIDNYQIQSNTGQTWQTGNTSFLLGLPVGSYQFEIQANNAAGWGAYSGWSNWVTVSGPPGAPPGVSAIAADSSAFVSWDAAAENGATIDAYTVTASPGGQICTTDSALLCTVTGLTNGTSYTFSVVASSSLGSSATPGISNVAIPATVPGAPTGVTAVTGNGSAAVNWTAPSSDGGLAITSYTSVASPGGESCTTSATTCSILGLTLRTTYSFTVTATSPVGEGRVSAKSLAVVMGTPSSPTQVTATQAAAAALTVSWIPGSSNGVSTSSYVATAEPGGKVCSASVLTSCAISGLVNGSYSLTVVAKNALGASKPSTPAATAHVIGPPGAPRAVTVIPNNASATVSWTIPTYVGEGKVRYVVTSNTGVKHCITSAATSCTIDGLHNGSTYSFTVVATNVAGDGARSAPSSPVIVGAPGAPRGLTATAGNGAALLIWTAPLTGGTIKSYVVTSQPGDKNCTTSRTSCTVSGLTNGKVYTFKIQARNSFGVSPGAKVTNAVTPSTLPMAPTAVTATTSHESATITWVAGGAIGVSVRVSGYVVTASPGGQTCSASASTVLSCTVTGLTKGQSYTFSVKETSASGTGPASRSSKSVTIIDVPDAPSGVVSTAQDSSVVVT